LALSAGTAAPVPAGARKPPIYFPHRVGDRWVFWDGEFESTQVVAAVNVRDGRTVITVAVETEDDRLVPSRQVEVTERGVYELPRARGGSPRCLLDHPVRPGTTLRWKWDAGTESRTVRGPERVTVPAGTFEALRVEYWVTLPASPDPALVKTAWYAPGVGLVKCTGEVPHGDGVLRSFIPGSG